MGRRCPQDSARQKSLHHAADSKDEMKPAAKKFLRIVDANYNRLKEALRVLEDFSRFFLDDPVSTREFKKLRHDLVRHLSRFPAGYAALLEARDSAHDVGRRSWIQNGHKRPQWKELMVANMKRGQEAARVLEEISKILSPRQSPAFQRLRFRLYELEKKSFRKF